MQANYRIKDVQPLCSVNGSEAHWPSVFIIEGMGQTCNLLIVISAVEKGLEKAGLKFGSMGEVLRRLVVDEPDEITPVLKKILHQRLKETYSNVGFLGSADVKISGYVRQGQLISYEVQRNQAYGLLFHSTVKAYADSKLIARGTLVSAARQDQ